MNASSTFDVCVVGGGPAGSSLAIRLAKAGLNVVLIEQKKFPRAKLCGEFISPECLTHFDELGIGPAISQAGGTDLYETVFYARGGKSIAVKSEWFGQENSSALGLSRAEMDNLLLERAREVGVEVKEECSVAGLRFEGERVSGVTLRDSIEIDARLTIDATGRTQSLVRRLDKKERRLRARHVAFKTHLKNANIQNGACEIYGYRGGYGGCNRVENDLYDLCFIATSEQAKECGSDATRVMREVVFQNERAANVLKNAQVASEWLAVPIERFGRGSIAPVEGLIAIGDAAAFIDPFTGSGILLALESGKIAANAIARNFAVGLDQRSLAADYAKNYSAVFDRRLRVASVLRHAAFVPFAADMLVSVLNLNDKLLRRVARATRFRDRTLRNV